MEMLSSQLVGTFVPPQYGNFMTMDKSSVSPGVSPEITLVFETVAVHPVTQEYVLRVLEHPLNYRRSPAISISSKVMPNDKFSYGRNRPEQTGEQDPHGFRTTAWAKYLHTVSVTDPTTFVPGEEVVSLNAPAANRSRTTHADSTYPFCEPSTKDNSTLDFYHLLLTGVCSPAKTQIFTALTVQEPGQFLSKSDQTLPMGHLVVSVYRSWGFTQKDTIEMFHSDDGVPYWYHRRTGQTFWERPLYDEEKAKPKHGGTVVDLEHPEEPMTVHAGQEGAERRYLQGQFRQQMLTHHETDNEARLRRQRAQSSITIAKQVLTQC